MIELKNINKSFPSKNGKKEALKNINLSLDENTTTGIMGKSGSGKSTLAKILLRLLEPDSGSIQFNGIDISHKKNKDLKDYRKQVQLISQRPQSFFDPSMTMGNSIRETLGNFNRKKDLKFPAFDDLLQELKLNKDLLIRYPHQISGGEIQRFALCRALILEPQYLILDEATSMLDTSVQAQILNLLKQIRKKYQIGYLMISHDQHVIDYMCDIAYIMEKGQLKRRVIP